MKRKTRIGLIVDYLTSEYTESLMVSVQTFCKDHDIDLLFFTVSELFGGYSTYDYQNSSANALIRINNLDGIIITAGTQLHGISKEEFSKYLNTFSPLPVVTISATFEGYPSIIVNSDKAYEQLINYLIEKQGSKKIGFIDTDSNSVELDERRELIYTILEKNNIKRSEIKVWKSNLEYGSCYKVLLEDYQANGNVFDCDTVISINDDIAYACIDFIHNHTNKKVPDDVIVTGYDDLKRASFSDTTLTSINQQVAYQGTVAAEILLKMIKGESYPKIEVIEAKAIVRDSTERVVLDAKNFPKTEFLEKDIISLNTLHDKFSVSEWYKKRSQIYSAAKFYSNHEGNILLNDLPVFLTEELQKFGFPSALIVLYDEPVRVEPKQKSFDLPEKAKLMGFDYKAGFNTKDTKKDIIFNPREIIVPDEYISYCSEGSIVSILYHNEIQYGYIVFGCNDNDSAVYELMTRSVGAQISSSYEYSKLIQEQYSLHDRYKKLDIIANSDELTGLKNRRGLVELGSYLLNFSEAAGQGGLVIYCDMDGLKKINDTYGHDEGDCAIKAQGAILSDTFRSNDMVARIAGDEFVIISPGLTESIFNVMKDNIARSCDLWSSSNEKPYQLSISLGAVSYPDKDCGYDLTGLLSKADAVLYQEKTRKKAAAK
ncbi:MAG: GGDEF domain-containing protein [Treponema sp.]|nr:GGDEF domain-containing protein [Treponema sp.]